jgi:hypothetical protein
MLATLSRRTSESAAVNATSLPAPLNVAESLLRALVAAVLVYLGAVAAVAGGVTPKRLFNPSRLLRMSMRITPYEMYRQAC